MENDRRKKIDGGDGMAHVKVSEMEKKLAEQNMMRSKSNRRPYSQATLRSSKARSRAPWTSAGRASAAPKAR